MTELSATILEHIFFNDTENGNLTGSPGDRHYPLYLAVGHNTHVDMYTIFIVIAFL